ncbi:hypothetical protein GCK72_023203 [Caenorhabditis remanei]|uniref:Uncharacterized protein n=1 Tax=Caenorhabditis remanei TaxID=31234 RepID=A0A6A5FVY7_CAERE|nr:hypothetical protein GCK72_023203 [Caenorhabditis remanei]KAF1746746.1 hypothetical protein GCK72_023203 [Caenorhabditis remanei]
MLRYYFFFQVEYESSVQLKIREERLQEETTLKAAICEQSETDLRNAEIKMSWIVERDNKAYADIRKRKREMDDIQERLEVSKKSGYVNEMLISELRRHEILLESARRHKMQMDNVRHSYEKEFDLAKNQADRCKKRWRLAKAEAERVSSCRKEAEWKEAVE